MLPRPLSSTRTDTLFPHTTLCRSLYFINDEPFAVILADDLVLAGTPCIKQLVDAHAATGGNIVAVMDVPKDQTDRYGILDVESDDGRLAAVRGLVEKPKPQDAPSTLSIIGRRSEEHTSELQALMRSSY